MATHCKFLSPWWRHYIQLLLLLIHLDQRVILWGVASLFCSELCSWLVCDHASWAERCYNRDGSSPPLQVNWEGQVWLLCLGWAVGATPMPSPPLPPAYRGPGMQRRCSASASVSLSCLAGFHCSSPNFIQYFIQGTLMQNLASWMISCSLTWPPCPCWGQYPPDIPSLSTAHHTLLPSPSIPPAACCPLARLHIFFQSRLFMVSEHKA